MQVTDQLIPDMSQDIESITKYLKDRSSESLKYVSYNDTSLIWHGMVEALGGSKEKQWILDCYNLERIARRKDRLYSQLPIAESTSEVCAKVEKLDKLGAKTPVASKRYAKSSVSPSKLKTLIPSNLL